MTREEFGTLVKGINSVYPNTIQTEAAFNIWFSVLSDLTYQEASAGLQRHMVTSEFAPKPASIRKNVVSLCMDNVPQLTAQEAWSKVYRAICNSSYYAEEEFAKLPAEVQRAVGGPERLRELAGDSNFNEGVESSNFMRTYTELQKRKREESALPNSLRIGARAEWELTDGMGNS